MFNGKIHYKWPCSIAKLNYQRVNHLFLWAINTIAMTIASSQWPQHPGTIGLRSPECRTHALQVFRPISNRLSRSELATWQSRMNLYTLGSLHHHFGTPSWWLVFGAVMFFWKHVRSGLLLKNAILIKFICITVLTFVFFHVFIGFYLYCSC